MLPDNHFWKYSRLKIGNSTCPFFNLIAQYHISDIKSIYIKYITKSTEDGFRQAKFLKVLSYLNAITMLSESHTDALERIGGVFQNFLIYGHPLGT